MCEIFQKKNNVGQNWGLFSSSFLKWHVIENYKTLKIIKIITMLQGDGKFQF
jgi:hypothetical protein